VSVLVGDGNFGRRRSLQGLSVGFESSPLIKRYSFAIKGNAGKSESETMTPWEQKIKNDFDGE